MTMTTQTRVAPMAGFHEFMPARVYHADPCGEPSLSSTIARTILSKSLAHAHAEHPRLGGTAKKDPTAAMDRGSCVHSILAGTSGEDVELGDFPTFLSKASREWADSVRMKGKIPALCCDMEDAVLIARNVQTKIARGLTDDNNPFNAGRPEVTAIWSLNDVWFRARYDRLVKRDGEPCTAWDYKVTSDVSPAAVKRSFRRFGYHLQAAHYLAGLDALCPQFAGRHSFIFAFVEDAPPYSVRRYCLKTDTLGVAKIDIARAHSLWERAIKTNEWPDATTDQTTFIEIPTYDDDEQPDEIAV